MFSEKSIRSKLFFQLVTSSFVLIGVFSCILYYYIKSSLYFSQTKFLQEHAVVAHKNLSLKEIDRVEYQKPNELGQIVDTNVLLLKDRKPIMQFKTIREKNGKEYLELYYPLEYNPKYFLVLKQDISYIKILLDEILKDIIIVNIVGFLVVVFFSIILSKIILTPIKTLSFKLANVNEKYLNHIDTKDMFIEFLPLANNLNKLIDRVQTFIKYRTELFIGIAHELKTPLAVMKTKNEVTLLKSRDNEYYKKTIEQNIKSINEMNQMIGAVLSIGRQESDQLKPPMVVDLVTFIKQKSDDFEILAKLENKTIELDIRPSAFPTLTQPTLVLHILQNFVQNAIKFSPENGVVKIKTSGNDEGFLIEVIDNGCGLKDDFDIFAPFKRAGEKSGVGLGLFLANGAAKALNSTISVKNRDGCKGTIATLFIPRTKAL